MPDAIPPLRFGDCICFHDSGFVSWRIRSRTNGWANHVAFVASPSIIWHSTFGKGLHSLLIERLELHKRNAVILRPYNSMGQPWEFSEAAQNRAWEFFAAEQGSKYDVGAIAGFLFLSYRNRWQNPDGWFCSEWHAAVSAAAGLDLFSPCADAASISPADCGNASAYRPIWYRLPAKVAENMRLAGVPHG